MILVENSVFFLQNCIIYEDNFLEYTDKNYAAKGWGVKQMLTGLTKGGGEVGEIMTMVDEGERGVEEMLTMADEGGRRVRTSTLRRSPYPPSIFGWHNL